MKRINLLGKSYFGGLIILVIVISLTGCNQFKDDLKDKLFITAKGVTMGDYMKMSPDTFGELYKILEKTNSVTFLNAYGSYTFFAPNNEAILGFVQSQGKSSVDDFTSDDDIILLKNFVKLHLCQDTITSDRFVDGGLPDTTMSGNILATQFGAGGINDITLCKTAKIIRRDIKTINGIIHVINKALSPTVFFNPIYNTIAQNPDYSIFAEALRQTGLMDSLKPSSFMDNNGNSKSYAFTVFVVPDLVYQKYNINSYNDLFNRFSNTKNPHLNLTDSLYLLMANHCIRGSSVYFLRDFANQNYLSMSYDYLTVSIQNALTINSTFLIDKNLSDNVSKNGVFHLMDSMMVFKIVPAAPLYLDIGMSWPELTTALNPDNSNKPFYRVTSLGFPNKYFPTGLSSVRVGKERTDGVANYNYSVGDNYVMKDHFDVNDLKKIDWVEFDLPAVNAGNYNLWICAKCKPSRVAAYILIDGKMVGSIETSSPTSSISNPTPTDMLLHNLDTKKYDNITLSGAVQSNQYVGLMVNSTPLYFPKTTTHVIRFKYIPNQPSTYLTLTMDMIHLIPVDMDQKTMTFPNAQYPCVP